AGYGARLGGWLIDWVILVVVGLIVNAPLHQLKNNTTVSNGTTMHRLHLGLGGIVIDALIIIVYGGLLCGSSRGQTVGMMAVGTRAVRVDGGGPIGYGRAFGRAAFEYLMAVLLILPWVIDMLFPLWDAQNQTLHDKVASTVVVKT
ncbi:MAG: RDD family protein, partial [Acidimicrobiales bacterium]